MQYNHYPQSFIVNIDIYDVIGIKYTCIHGDIWNILIYIDIYMKTYNICCILRDFILQQKFQIRTKLLSVLTRDTISVGSKP